jgi:acetyl-CoA acetyltransferase
MSVFGAREAMPGDLFAEAYQECLASVDGDLAPSGIDEAYVGNLGVGGFQLGNLAPFLAAHADLPELPARRVENACASSGYALRDAVVAVSSGRVDVALVAGIEKMNDLSRIHQRYWLGVSGDTEWERTAGLTFPGVYAQMARRHMHEHGTTREHLAAVAVKNHANGARNPKAQFQKEVTLAKALASPMVADPLGLFDCCATTDGAACLLVASETAAAKATDTPVWITGSGAASDHVAAFQRPSMTRIPATTRAAAMAMDEAGVSVKELDLLEVHDCFTIAEIMALEDLGLCRPGQGGPYTESGATARGGQTPVNPSGGLKAKGHPLGATGAAQAVEVFLQLRGQAGRRQVPDATTALTHNVGGSGASCAVHVFQR